MMTPLRVFRGMKNIGNTCLYRLGRCYRTRRLLPEQTAADRRLFKRVFRRYAGKSLRVFEWGSGYSTFYYARYLSSSGIDFEWHAIDNSKGWRDKVAGMISRYRLDSRVQLHLAEFPAFWELPGWSWEEKQIPPDVCTPEAIKYVEYPRQLAGEQGFDVIIVDGRFRRRCLEVASRVLAPGGMVILHDAQKKHYHRPLGLFKHGQFFNTGRILGANEDYNIWLGTFDASLLSNMKNQRKRDF